MGNETDANDSAVFFTPDIDAPNSWVWLTNFPKEVRALLLGASAPGAKYPTLMLHSEHGGYYECRDFDPAKPRAASCVFRFKYPPDSGILDLPIGGDGDRGLYGRFVFTGGNTGMVMGTDYRATIECKG